MKIPKWTKIKNHLIASWGNIKGRVALYTRFSIRKIKILFQKIPKWIKVKNYLIAYWAKTQDGVALLLRFSIRKFKVLFLPIQRLFGFSVIKDPSKFKTVDLSTYLTETDAKVSELPRSYRELFKYTSKIENELFVNPSNNVLHITKAHEAWQEGLATNVAIIGERGSGKSTLITRFKTTFTEEPAELTIDVVNSLWRIEQLLSIFASSFGATDIHKPETLIRFINNQKEGTIVYLEGLQNMFLRNINGFDALEALWLIISETKEKVFWVVTCSRYAWEFLNKAEGIETHFTHLLFTDVMTDEQLKTVIMNRHSKSVYRLDYEADEITKRSRGYKKRIHKLEELQQYLSDLYFHEMTDIAEGNASIAIILWLRSIKKVEGRTITISPFRAINLEGLEILTSEILFALAFLILHDSLKVAELARVMNIGLSDSRVLLSRLKSRGVLIESNGQYTLNQLVLRQVLRLLKKRNIIH